MSVPPITPSSLGRSLGMRNGDLEFRGGDLTLVDDRANLAQGLQTMIETPVGTDLFDIRYGFDYESVFSRPNSLRYAKALIQLNLVKTLSLDDRVREIREIVFDDDPRFAELVGRAAPASFSVRTEPRRHWRVLVVLATDVEADLAILLQDAGV
jgi:hypothetical protein